MNIGNKPAFTGEIRIKGQKPLKTELYKDDIVVSQMTNNLRRVGIDRFPGSVDSNGALVVQPGLNVSHNKKADTITFTIGPADQPVAKYIVKKGEQGKTLDNMEPHVKIFEDAIKYIDETIRKAKEKSNILSGVDTKSVDEVYSAVHRNAH